MYRRVIHIKKVVCNDFLELEWLCVQTVKLFSSEVDQYLSAFLAFCCANRVTIWAATWQNEQSECAPSENSDQPGHPPSLIRDFAVRMKKAWVLSYPLSAQRRLWSDWVYAQTDLSLRWAYTHFVGFIMSRLISFISKIWKPVVIIIVSLPFSLPAF